MGKILTLVLGSMCHEKTKPNSSNAFPPQRNLGQTDSYLPKGKGPEIIAVSIHLYSTIGVCLAFLGENR